MNDTFETRKLRRSLHRLQARLHDPRYPVVRTIKTGRFWQAHYRDPERPERYLIVLCEFFTQDRAEDAAWTAYSKAKQRHNHAQHHTNSR